MRHLKIISILLTMIVAFGCNNSKNYNNQTSGNVSSEQLSAFEKELTADGFFWQSEYGNRIDFLFMKNGMAYVLTNGRPETKMAGKWSFDKSYGELQIAWEGEKQYAPKIESIDADWKTISLSTKIHEYGSETLTRMKLLDDRFNQ